MTTNPTENSLLSILIFTDFSDAAVNASNYAAAFASQLHATRLLICYSEHIPSTMEAHIQNIMFEEQVHKRYVAKLDALTNTLRNQINEPISIKAYIDQRPLDVIVDSFNKDQSIGLIVMGLAAKSALDQTLLGSNTIRISKVTTIPLLIIPENASFKTIEKVVFACDLKNVSKSIPIHAIKRLVHKLGAKLSILNVGRNEGNFNAEIIEKRNYLGQLWNSEKPEYYYIDNEDIVMGIMNFANTNQIQLVIAVPKKYSFFENLFHNSITKKLTQHMHLPLLLFKEEKL
jgi:nucleotide-binding universal stress UspA family protein